MQTRTVIRWFVTLCLLLTAVQASMSGAQTPSDAGLDPPERVGRLSAIEGDVQAWNEAQQAWQPAQLNLPVTSRSAFLTGPGARAEVKVGSAALRMDADSQANLVRLDDGGTDIDVPRGTVGIRLRAPADPAWQIAVGQAVVSLASPGSYRVDVDPARGLLVTRVFEGQAEIDAAGTRTVLAAGQQSSFDLANQRQIGLTALMRTPFDDWSAQRDREQDRLQAWRYVSPEMTGVESLDAAGDWRADPSYGPVWYPSAVPAGWAPYSTGRWVWMPPWGWNWVDDAPWGFAPFHYGRWVLVDNSWGWVPGPYVRRPVYAPALVGFYGNGGRVSFAPAFGSSHGAWAGVGGQHGPVAGWFPLAPGESWHPPYRASGGYLQSLNRGHGYVRPPSNGGGPGLPVLPYRYAQVPHASTLVPQSAITGSRSVWSNRLPMPGDRGDRGDRIDRSAMIRPPGYAAPQGATPRMAPMPDHPGSPRWSNPPRAEQPSPQLNLPGRERGFIAPPIRPSERPSERPPNQRFTAPSPQSYAPPAQQAYGSPGRQVYAPPTRQDFTPPARQSYAPPVRQTYAAPMQQSPAPSSRGYSGESGRSGHSGRPADSGGGQRGGGHQR